MNKEAKNELFKRQKEKDVRRKNLFTRIFLLVIVVGYTIFFTSEIWYRDDGSSTRVTEINKTITNHERDFQLEKWTYCNDQNMMEVVISVNNKALDGINTYTFKAMDRDNGILNVKPIVEKEDLYVLHISIPKNWKVSVVQMRFPKEVAENEYQAFFMNRQSVEEVATIEALSETEYRIEKCELEIAQIEDVIAEEKKEIESNNATIATYEEEILKVEDSLIYQTEKEQTESKATMEKARKAIEQLKQDNSDIESAISEENSKIEMLEKQITDLKNR